MTPDDEHASASGPDAGSVSPDHWITQHTEYLYQFAVGQVRDGGVAEDLVQETLLAAWKARERYAGQSAERTWLVGILRHKIYDHFRRACRERRRRVEWNPGEGEGGERVEEAMFWLHDVASECQTPQRRLELAEFREQLELALGELPPRIAQVFQLYAVEERSNAEVCAQLDISGSNLWVMLHRARKQLKDRLATWWESHGGDSTGGWRGLFI